MKPDKVRVGDKITGYGEVLGIRFDESAMNYVFTFPRGEVRFSPNCNLPISYVNMTAS